MAKDVRTGLELIPPKAVGTGRDVRGAIWIGPSNVRSITGNKATLRSHIMQTQRRVNVAVLLATYNGSRYVAEQIDSLKENATPFTLHWLDDGSSDNTREVVQSSARKACIDLTEWHQPRHLGLPSSFFQLLDCVEADVYLFCDQDDIWQPQKIDATVANLAADIESPVLCFSDYLVFKDSDPGTCRRMSDFVGKERLSEALKKPPIFQMFTPVDATAQAQGFTRPLREMLLRHKAVACKYAFMHDWWMYDIAVASGEARMLSNVPTSLWRRHEDSFCSKRFGGLSPNQISKTWRDIQYLRRAMARHAQGFILATPTLPLGRNLERLLELARLIAAIDRRQTPADLVRLARRGAIHADPYVATSFSVACLSSNAKPFESSMRSTSV